ncbi:MAG: peptidylprolyl isomerase [Rhodothermales bacterium]
MTIPILPKYHGFVLYALLAATACCFPARQAHAQDSSEVVDEIVAVVGDRILLRSEVDGVVLGLLQQQQMPYTEDLWMVALNQMIDQKVMTIHAERDTNIVIADEQVEQALNQRIDQLTAQAGGTAQFEEFYGKSLLDIRGDLREELHDQMLADQIRNGKIGGIKITPSEVTEWFSQFPQDSLPVIPEIVRISHIVRYPVPAPEAKAYARELISVIRDSIVVGGASLEEYARLYSEDQGSAENGGRYTSSRLGELVPEFAAVASRSPIGEVSPVFESPFGYHILRVNNRKGDIVDFNHILIQVDDSKADPADAIALLGVVRDSIVTSGVPFELMARRYSEEEISKRLGGRVVDPRTGERDLVLQALNYTWRQTINTIQPGEISEPAEVELLDGKRAFHIVFLHRRVPEHPVDILTDYERIQDLALQDKQNRVMTEWLEELRTEVYIDLRGKAKALSLAANTL